MSPLGRTGMGRHVLSKGGPRRTDVAVVGKGPAGAAAALSLARLGASVVVLDRGTQRVTLGESLPPAATPTLQHLCLWDEFLAGGHRPSYGNRSTWGSDIPQETDFIRSPYGSGWHLDRPAFEDMLEAALDGAGVPVMTGTRLLAVDCGRGSPWALTVQTGSTSWRLDADFLIDASGRARRIARLLGASRCSYDRLIGILGVLATSKEDTDSVTEIEATADGWWYVSPLPNGDLVAGYMTDADGTTARMAGTREGWTHLLGRTVSVNERVAAGGYRPRGPIRRVGADSSRLQQSTGNGWCAAGDAAAAYDPLSSQGIASALATGMWAAESLAGSHAGGRVHYEERMDHLWARYLSQWLGYYALEQRWAQSQFWRRRHRVLEDLLQG